MRALDRRTNIAVIVLIVMAVAAAWLTRDTGAPAKTNSREAVTPPSEAHDITEPSPQVSSPVSSERQDESAGGQGHEPSPEPRELPRFVEVGAQGCVPCRMMQPVLDELRSAYAGKLEVEFADVGANPELAAKYGVRTIPTQVIYDASGQEVFRHIGYWPKEEIDAKLEELGLFK